MNNILDIVAEILGGNPVLQKMPESPSVLTALFEYSASPPTHYFAGISYEYNVQVRTRGKKPEEMYSGFSNDAFELAVTAQNKLSGYYDDKLSIMQVSNILNIGQDSKGRQEYTVNFQISFK